MSIRLPIAALLMIMFSGICFFLFIGFNHAFHSDGGLQSVIWASANDTLTGDRLTSFNEWMPKISQGFGIASVMMFALGIVIFVVQAFGSAPRQME